MGLKVSMYIAVYIMSAHLASLEADCFCAGSRSCWPKGLDIKVYTVRKIAGRRAQLPRFIPTLNRKDGSKIPAVKMFTPTR
jgi:hypothetical protein